MTELTVWNDQGKYWWADMDNGPRHGPFPSYQEAHLSAQAQNPAAVYASCPVRFYKDETGLSTDASSFAFTQEMAETYGDNR